MAGISLYDDQWIDITPADPAVDQADIILMLTALVELTKAGALSTPTPDRETCDRLARLMAPYVRGVTTEALGAAFAIEPSDIVRVLRRVLLIVLYQPPETP